MGGEVTALVGALDPRFTTVIPAGYSPDMNVMRTIHTHGCWEWVAADITEFIDQSDLVALAAPRTVVIETGKQDTNFSSRTPAWSSDVQVVRRARFAWNGPEESQLLQHYLHYDAHRYHFGELLTYDPPPPLGVVATPRARYPRSLDWQVDGVTGQISSSLFDFISTN